MEYKYLFKFIVIGDTGVGKSCLVLQFLENKFRQAHEVTIGVEFGTKNLNIQNNNVKIQIWDTAGQENFRSITRSYYRSAIGAVLVYDITQRETFQNIEKWLQDMRQSCPTGIVIALVGNKCDLTQNRAITYDEGQALAKTHDLHFIETSAKTGESVENCFTMIAQELYEKIESFKLDPNETPGIKVGSQYKDLDVIDVDKQVNTPSSVEKKKHQQQQSEQLKKQNAQSDQIKEKKCCQ